jgi:hypothetical protein
LEVVIKVSDEASKPAEHIAKALGLVDAEIRKLTADIKPLDSLLVSLTKSLKGFDAATGTATKELMAFDKETVKVVTDLKKIEDAARKAGAALKGVKGPGGHGGGDGHKGGHAEGLFGLAGGYVGGLFATGPLGILMGTAKELGEAFEGLTDKILEATIARDQEVADLASRGIKNPEEFHERLAKQAFSIGTTKGAMFSVANILGLAPFKGKDEDRREQTIQTRAEEIIRLAGGNQTRAEAIANLLSKAAEGAKIKPAAALALGADFKGPATLQNIEKFLDKQLTKAIPVTTGVAAGRLKDAWEDLFEAPNPALIDALNNITAFLKDPKVIEGFATATGKLTDSLKQATTWLHTAFDWWFDGIKAFQSSELGKRIETDYQQKKAEADGTSFKQVASGLTDTYFNRVYRLSQQGKEHKPIPGEPGFGHAEGGITLSDHPAKVHRDEVILPLSKAAGVLSDAMQKGGGGGMAKSLTLHPGAVQINVQQKAGEDAEQISRRVADLVPVILNSAFEQMSIQATGGIA